jgi:hypothetical protein
LWLDKASGIAKNLSNKQAHTSSQFHRAGRAKKACAERAGTVAGKIFKPRQFRHLLI